MLMPVFQSYSRVWTRDQTFQRKYVGGQNIKHICHIILCINHRIIMGSGYKHHRQKRNYKELIWLGYVCLFRFFINWRGKWRSDYSCFWLRGCYAACSLKTHTQMVILMHSSEIKEYIWKYTQQGTHGARLKRSRLQCGTCNVAPANACLYL